MDIEQIATVIGLVGAGFGAVWALGRGGGSIRAITPIGRAAEGQTVRVRGRVKALDPLVRSTITDTPCVASVSRVRNDIEEGRVVTGIDLVRDLTGERFVIEGNPFTELSVDILKLPKRDCNHNLYVVVIIDSFSRWVSLEAVPDKSALSAARAILKTVGNFGVPLT